MANVLEIVIRASDSFSRPLREAEQQLESLGRTASNVGRGISTVGLSLSLLAAPAIAGLADATRSAVEFDRSVTNIRSLTGQSTEEFAAMKDELLRLGSESIAGPQAVADAMYDIASGVSDASTHLAILEASIATSEAGASELSGTTAALVSVMNSYRLGATQAGRASDVLTRIVGVGVGTMDEFAAAIPTVTGVAAQVGESFDEVGAELAYLTTKGYTASVAATQIRAAFVALLNPNETMKDQLAAIGFESGSAALEQLGLVETYRRLSEVSDGSVDAMARSVGSVEGLQAVLQLTTDAFREFNTGFQNGVDGATEAAQEIQRSGAAAQFEILAGKIETLKIRVGDALVPALQEAYEELVPVVDEIAAWAEENPDAVLQVAALTGGVLLLGAGMGLLGGIINGVVAVVDLLASAIGVLTGTALLPLLPVLAVGAGLVLAYETNFLGFRDTVDKVADSVRSLVGELREWLFDDELGRRVLLWLNPLAYAGSLPSGGGEIALPPGVDNPFARAMGGMATAGTPYIVGERGPELFVPVSSGHVLPNHRLGSGDYYEINITLPESAIRDPARARLAGEAFGEAIMRRLRERG